ncbi:PREDICTED: U6 snRNA-associated Sm-like protein LSm7 isoform X3 [Galeopterus variegatus]|uniref:U6 snRNA-associated Sm-like protein LSm7 isoform X3 n=1 Tax=Galeopterus variegatus TaxID=482537 RepID=A0ABM0REJ1_GALVR|nr:PREDICTED: U6 snRNA-associated Sm-like protein LSm7 isoform X3 [Galeopterus variegatus]
MSSTAPLQPVLVLDGLNLSLTVHIHQMGLITPPTTPVAVRIKGGILKGFDPLLNLVLDGTIEYMRDPDDQYKLTEDTRQLGLVVCRGTSVVLICPQDGMEAIPNPFIQQQDA